ncbi:MAG: nucleotidyltransferase domain-containing protein [bacterium]|nr:nucleotidyltransferase domain-containing protein [bacterium]MCY3580683.1 nucleotidyltransferase domain-containing protein [bacterium]MCY3652005.1 nucleotidyltransferase domain-containing protein [bacterium]MYH54643.1 nucleotidyltransferase domain-containing protein [Acidimicrobiia bacterium]
MVEDGWAFEDPWPTFEEALAAATAVAGKARELYGEELVEVLMYGSRARGDHDPESDLDLLLVKRSNGPVSEDSSLRELRRFVRMKLAMESADWVMVSLYACSLEQVLEWDTSFYRNVRADSIKIG